MREFEVRKAAGDRHFMRIYTIALTCDTAESVGEGIVATPLVGGAGLGLSVSNFGYHSATAFRDEVECEEGCKKNCK
jgi:hypothetical protein